MKHIQAIVQRGVQAHQGRTHLSFILPEFVLDQVVRRIHFQKLIARGHHQKKSQQAISYAVFCLKKKIARCSRKCCSYVSVLSPSLWSSSRSASARSSPTAI